MALIPRELSLLAAAEEAGDEPAVFSGEQVLSFADLAPRVREALEWLDRTRVGDRISVLAEPRLSTLVMLYAAFERGGTAVLVHPRLTPRERSRQSELSGLSRARGLAPVADPAGPRDLAIVFTSGSSGTPKGVLVSAGALCAAAQASEALLGRRGADRWLLGLPLAHVSGLAIAVRALSSRKPLVLSEAPAFSPQHLIDLVMRFRVTLASLVPTQLRRLLDHQPRWDPPPHLRAILLGGAPASGWLLDEAAARGWPILPSYGLSETCGQVATRRPGAPDRGCGPALPGAEVRIEDGEILVRGSMVASGYLDGPLPMVGSAGGAWLRTGDCGSLDEEGNLHVGGRRDQRIVSGGENVDPIEVEELLARVPGIAAACVFGVPDALWGQAVVAVLAGPKPLDDRVLGELLGAELAPWKRPRRIAWLPSLPEGPNGKLDRVACAAAAAPLLRPLQSG